MFCLIVRVTCGGTLEVSLGRTSAHGPMIERAQTADSVQQQRIDVRRNERSFGHDGHEWRVAEEVLIDQLIVQLRADLLDCRQRPTERMCRRVGVRRHDAYEPFAVVRYAKGVLRKSAAVIL